MRVSRRKRKKNAFFSFLTGVIIVGMVAGLSFGVAWAWQGLEDAQIVDPASGTASSVPQSLSAARASSMLSSSGERGAASPGVPSPSSVDPPSEVEVKAASTQSSAEDSSSEPVDKPKSVARVRPEYSYALPETAEMAPKSYFDDALFFGDSLSVGIPMYGVMDNASVIAFQGISTVNVNTKEAVDVKGDGVRVTMLDAAKQMYPDKNKIYIMLGGNGLDYDEEAFIEGYRTFVESVQEAYPQARIFLQSMTPVTEFAYKTYPSVSNEKINRYNLAIMEMAEELRVYFVDVAAALMDETGKLPTEASPSDGMHIGTEYYHKWFDYLRMHTAE